ncbi:MAG: hypothetical protein IIZ16_07730, partial [Selenomonas sp.]|nr:hypothetical protein [Selenomonas sp.]
MGRMWHSLLLGKWNEIFYWLPIEELIHSRQQEYYSALGKSDRQSDSSAFVEFLLGIILDTLTETTVVGNTDEKAKETNPSVQKLLDVLGNCMEMVSPHAVFWGGGHRYMIQPHVYPYHDGGWRDSFMKKIYDGNFLGDDGAIAFALKGIKKVGQKDGEGEFSWDNMKANLGSVMGEGMAMLGAAISNISSMFGGGNFLDSIGEKLQNVGAGDDEEKKAAANKKVTNLFSNLKTMWHSK